LLILISVTELKEKMASCGIPLKEYIESTTCLTDEDIKYMSTE